MFSPPLNPAVSWSLVENAQIDGADLCMDTSASSGGFSEVASQTIESEYDPYYTYAPSDPYAPIDANQDPYYGGGRRLLQTGSYCQPMKVCDSEENVKIRCEQLVPCVAFNYDGSCGVLKTNSTYKTPSDNGTMKVWIKMD
jgi:hypothetical protein